jgi:hypothetical protein
MANAPAGHLGPFGFLISLGASKGSERCRRNHVHRRLALLSVAFLLARLVSAQGSPHVIGVEPSTGKVNDDVTVTGENLGKGKVSSVFLSDEKTDYKAALVDQAGEKIVMKVPQVKPGDYNVSIQVGNEILIQPVRFKVQ